MSTQRVHNRKRRQPKKPPPRTPVRDATLQEPYQQYRVVGLSNLIPASTYTTLVYTDPTVTRLAIGIPWTLFTLRANDVWDPDPALGSGAIAGFREFANFYQKWRVIKLKVQWEIVNLSNAPITAYINYTSDINTIPANYAAAVSFADNPQSSISRTVSQSATGANKTRITCSFDLPRIYGSTQEYMAVQDFVGNGGPSPTSPGNRTFLNFIGFSNANMTQGVYSRLRIQFQVHFFDRIPLVT
jgi:hypothetical protein